MSFRLMKPITIGTDIALDEVRVDGTISRKLDGIRACVQKGATLSNSGTPIASLYCRELVAELEGFDGEFIYGDPAAKDVYNKTQSAVNSKVFPRDLDPSELRFYVFDYKYKGLAWKDRLAYLRAVFSTEAFKENYPQVVLLEQEEVRDMDDVQEAYNAYLAEGFEGLIYKKNSAFYKEGRSGKTDQCMLRLKPFGTTFYEAQILGYNCAFRNENEATTSNLGYTKRSSAKANRIPLDMLGSFHVRDCTSGITFDLPVSSMTHDERVSIWKHIDDFVGQYVRYTCLDYGRVNKPRMPSFRGFRAKTDFSPTGDF